MQVFISHSSKDRKEAKELSLMLAEAGLKVWLAEEHVLPGENWSLEVGKALSRSKAMVVVLSPDAVKSEWVRREIQYALSSPRFEGRLIPVIVRPTKDIPWILKQFARVDLRHERTRAAKRIVDILLGEKSEEAVDRIVGKAKMAHA